jgi:DDE superfamily endonuclease
MNKIVTQVTSVENSIKLFSQNQKINELLQQSNVRKDKGVSLDILFQFLVRIAFTGKNLFRLVDSSATPPGIGKDVVYRFFNCVSSNWRKFLLLLSTRVIVQELLPLTDDSTTKVLIADDTLYRRDRSKKVELLARVHDHNTNSYHRGFRMLTLGWSDGNSFIPMLFSMLSSAKEKNRLAPMRSNIDKRTNGYKRRQESIKKSPDVLVEMVALAMTAGTKAKHLLFDSWFAFPATIRRIHELGMHTICMLKDTKNIHYTFQGDSMTLKELFYWVRKRPGRAKVLASIMVTIGEDAKGNPLAAKVVFVRNRSSKSWLAVLATDTTLTDEEIIKLYGMRWDIEVFFKITKSFLNLATECQSRSFDALVAHTTVVCSRYIMLTLARRTNSDPRTLGTLFHAVCDELRQTSFIEALALLLKLLERSLNKLAGFSKELMNEVIEQFVAELPIHFKARMLLSALVIH